VADAGAEALAASPHLANLTKLGLMCNGVGDNGLIALLTSPLLRGLEELYLDSNRITRNGLRAIGGFTTPATTQVAHPRWEPHRRG
jgi:hypothetical protein